MKKYISFILALCMVMAMCVPAFAGTIETSGGNASAQVTLSSTEDGELEGTPAPTKLSVTVPTTLPLAVSPMGEVKAADDVKIENHSYGAVRVASMTITNAGLWKLTAFGDKKSLASEKVDSNKIGLSITLGSGSAHNTTADNETSQQVLASYEETGIMSGSADNTKNTLAVKYDAIVTPLSSAVTTETVANVQFVVEWDKA